MSSDAHAEAFKTLLTTATKAPVLDPDEAQKLATLPDRYTIIFLSRRFGGNVRGGSRENPLRRLQTRVAAKSISDARLLEDRIADAFKYATVDLGDVTTGVDYEAGGGAFDGPDAGGYYSDLTDWTFAV